MTTVCQLISDPTETRAPGGILVSEQKETIPARGWIFYDGKCPFCIAAARRFERLTNSRGFVSLPLQTPWVLRRLGLVPGAPLEEMRVLTINGDIYGGAKAVLFLASQFWFLRPLAVLGQIPPLHSAIDAAYRWVAAHRGCVSGQCRLGLTNSKSPSRRLIGMLPLMLFSLIAIALRPLLEPWLFMWLMAGSIFLGCKWLTLYRAKQRGAHPTVTRQFAYLFLSGGMDADRFFGPTGPTKSLGNAAPRIAAAIGKIALGALLLFGMARYAGAGLVAGWLGMIGMILMAHFGVFDLTATWWQTRGIPTKPIMNAPWRSAQLSEFWGRRWNRAFQQLVINNLFRPIAASLGSIRATLLTFFISGLLHELVISLPAGAGYGLPTAYFLLQGWGLIAQRTPIGGRLWFANRFFTQFLLIAPAIGLFHPPFIRRVIIPFMQTIGAL